MATRVQLRRDTAANWTAADPILAQGEIGLETNTLKLKIGDGATLWHLLSYYNTAALLPPVLLDQTVPQTMSGGAFAGSGLIKLTTGLLGVDIVNYTGQEAVSRDIYVDADTGNDINNGTGWGTAFKTLQHAIDSIQLVIKSGVSIQIFARGDFTDGGPEDYTLNISKVCEGTGLIRLRADDYISGATASAGGATTIDYAATTADDYWNNSYVYIQTGLGRGQVRRIIDTTTPSVGTTRLTVAAWDTTPNNTSVFAVSGRARISMGVQCGAMNIYGSYLTLQVTGFAVEDFTDYTELAGIMVKNGARASFGNVVLYNYSSENVEGGIVFKSGAQCSFNNSAIWACQNGMVVTAGAYVVANASNFYNNNVYNIWAHNAGIVGGFFSIYNNNFKGAAKSIYITTNSIFTAYNNYGTNGSSYGLRVDRGGQAFVIGTFTLSKSADAASFGYIG